MALIFPTTPSVGDTFSSGPWSWRWDGQKWVSSGGVGFLDAPSDNNTYGRKNAAWVEVPTLKGIIDGSIAGPGEVGETIISRGGDYAPMHESSTYYTFDTLNLTGGDWDVTVNYYVAFDDVPFYEYWIWIGPSTVPETTAAMEAADIDKCFFGDQKNTGLPLTVTAATAGPVRFNRSTNFSVDLRMRANRFGTPGNFSIDWIIVGRRSR